MFNEIYKDLIVRYNQDPYHYRKVLDATHTAEGYNQICGDQLNVTLEIKDDRLKEIGFEGDCCAVAKASASLMIQQLEGTDPADFEAEMANFNQSALFKELKNIPSRIECATLPWQTLKEALNDKNRIPSSK